MGKLKVFIGSKRCSKCHEEKPESSEYFLIDSRVGKFRAECRICAASCRRKRRKLTASEENKAAKNKYWQNRKERRSAQLKYYDANAEKIRERRRELYKHRMDNDPSFRELRRLRAKKHYPKRKQCHRYKISSAISKQIWKALRGKGGKSRQAWETLVGYSKEELIQHLERQFVDGMAWENFGRWHIDHIIPKSSFEFSSTDDPEFQRCWALTNLRPLWAKENMSKGAKIKFLI